MSETALINKFTKNEDDEIDRWLMATPTAQPKAEQKPQEQPKPAQPAAPQERGGGFFNSIKRAGYAPIERIKEGLSEVATGFRSTNPTNPAAGLLEMASGTLGVVFPLAWRKRKPVEPAEPKA